MKCGMQDQLITTFILGDCCGDVIPQHGKIRLKLQDLGFTPKPPLAFNYCPKQKQ